MLRIHKFCHLLRSLLSTLINHLALANRWEYIQCQTISLRLQYPPEYTKKTYYCLKSKTSFETALQLTVASQRRGRTENWPGGSEVLQWKRCSQLRSILRNHCCRPLVQGLPDSRYLKYLSVRLSTPRIILGPALIPAVENAVRSMQQGITFNLTIPGFSCSCRSVLLSWVPAEKVCIQEIVWNVSRRVTRKLSCLKESRARVLTSRPETAGPFCTNSRIYSSRRKIILLFPEIYCSVRAHRQEPKR